MKLSQYFELSEFEYSNTAKTLGINNTIPTDLIPNIVRLHDNVLYSLRKLIGHPVIISSGYRSPALNKAIGGVSNSQHAEGKAVDIIVKNQSNKAIFNWIRKNCTFDQLILENSLGTEWVHVSYNFDNNRKECLKYNGKTYERV